MKPHEHCFDPAMIAVRRNPTVEGALPLYEAFRRKMGWPYPFDATPEIVALACVHKARVRWCGSTKAIVRESKAWLVEHGMSPDSTTSNLAVH